MLGVILQSYVMLSTLKQDAILLSYVMLSAIMHSVILLSYITLSVILCWVSFYAEYHYA